MSKYAETPTSDPALAPTGRRTDRTAEYSVAADGERIANTGSNDELPGINALGEIDDASAPKGYDIHALDPVDGPASRFQLNVNPAGWANAGPATNAAGVWAVLADEAQHDGQPKVEEVRRVELYRLVTVDDDYALLPRGVLERVPEHRSAAPQRIGKSPLRAGPALDSFVLREADGPWGRWRDSQVWDELLAWARATKPKGHAAKIASDAIALAIAARHGFHIRAAWELP